MLGSRGAAPAGLGRLSAFFVRDTGVIIGAADGRQGARIRDAANVEETARRGSATSENRGLKVALHCSVAARHQAEAPLRDSNAAHGVTPRDNKAVAVSVPEHGLRAVDLHPANGRPGGDPTTAPEHATTASNVRQRHATVTIPARATPPAEGASPGPETTADDRDRGVTLGVGQALAHLSTQRDMAPAAGQPAGQAAESTVAEMLDPQTAPGGDVDGGGRPDRSLPSSNEEVSDDSANYTTVIRRRQQATDVHSRPESGSPHQGSDGRLSQTDAETYRALSDSEEKFNPSDTDVRKSEEQSENSVSSPENGDRGATGNGSSPQRDETNAIPAHHAPDSPYDDENDQIFSEARLGCSPDLDLALLDSCQNADRNYEPLDPCVQQNSSHRGTACESPNQESMGRLSEPDVRSYVPKSENVSYVLHIKSGRGLLCSGVNQSCSDSESMSSIEEPKVQDSCAHSESTNSRHVSNVKGTSTSSEVSIPADLDPSTQPAADEKGVTEGCNVRGSPDVRIVESSRASASEETSSDCDGSETLLEREIDDDAASSSETQRSLRCDESREPSTATRAPAGPEAPPVHYSRQHCDEAAVSHVGDDTSSSDGDAAEKVPTLGALRDVAESCGRRHSSQLSDIESSGDTDPDENTPRSRYTTSTHHEAFSGGTGRDRGHPTAETETRSSASDYRETSPCLRAAGPDASADDRHREPDEEHVEGLEFHVQPPSGTPSSSPLSSWSELSECGRLGDQTAQPADSPSARTGWPAGQDDPAGGLWPEYREDSAGGLPFARGRGILEVRAQSEEVQGALLVDRGPQGRCRWRSAEYMRQASAPPPGSRLLSPERTSYGLLSTERTSYGNACSWLGGLSLAGDVPPPSAAGRRRSLSYCVEMAAPRCFSAPCLDSLPGHGRPEWWRPPQNLMVRRSYSAVQLTDWEARRGLWEPRSRRESRAFEGPGPLPPEPGTAPLHLPPPSADLLRVRHGSLDAGRSRAAAMKLELIRGRLVQDNDEDEARLRVDPWLYGRHLQRWSRRPDAAVTAAAASAGAGAAPSASSNSTLDSESSTGAGAPEAPRSSRERLQESAAALLRRVDSLRSRRRRQQPRPRPAAADPCCHLPGDGGAAADELSPSPERLAGRQYLKDANSNDTELVDEADEAATKDGGWVRGGSLRLCRTAVTNWRSNSLNMGEESRAYRKKVQAKLKKKKKENRDPPLPPQLGAASNSPQLPSAAGRPVRGASENAPLFVVNRSYVDGCLPVVLPAGVRETRANSSPVIPGLSRVRSNSCDTTLSRGSDGSLASTAGSDQERKQRGGSVVRWHSFRRRSVGFWQPPPTGALSASHVSQLTCGQILVLRNHALLRITAAMERHCPAKASGWGWDLPKLMRRLREPDYRGRRVFGVPLTVTARRGRHPLPAPILQAVGHLRRTALQQVGLFRKSGVRSRIQKIRQLCEDAGDEPASFDEYTAFDVADMVKQYLRELPEVLLTNRVSQMLIAIYQYVPFGLRAELTRCALLLMPDESRLALQTLLSFLSDVAAASYANQMTAHNLAVCLAPSVFAVTSQRSSSASPRRTRRAGVPNQRELDENRAAHECLAALIRQAESLFCLPAELLALCRFSYLDVSQPVALSALGTEEQPSSWRAYTDACCAALLREARDRPRGWVSVPADDVGLELAYRKIGDGHHLRLWRAAAELEAPPQEALHRLLRQRHAYDLRLVKWRVVERLAADAEVFQYAVSAEAPLPTTEYCVLRAWWTDLPRGACAVVETSVEHPDAPLSAGSRRGVVLASRYLVEPCGAGKSKVTHFSRVEQRGCSPDWYHRVYGHQCARELAALRDSFSHAAEGPESRV